MNATAPRPAPAPTETAPGANPLRIRSAATPARPRARLAGHGSVRRAPHSGPVRGLRALVTGHFPVSRPKRHGVWWPERPRRGVREPRSPGAPSDRQRPHVGHCDPSRDRRATTEPLDHAHTTPRPGPRTVITRPPTPADAERARSWRTARPSTGGSAQLEAPGRDRHPARSR